MIVQRRYGLLRFASVENIPLQAERHSGGRQELFAFPLESVFAFRPECCSASQRNGVRLQTGIAFAFDRIPHKDIKLRFLIDKDQLKEQEEITLLMAPHAQRSSFPNMITRNTL